jgi:hypothetical protein
MIALEAAGAFSAARGAVSANGGIEEEPGNAQASRETRVVLPSAASGG